MDTNTLGGSPVDISAITLGGGLIIRTGGGSQIVGDRTFRFNQPVPSERWVISHPTFGKIPAIRVIPLEDEPEDEQIVFGVELSTQAVSIITFTPAFAGIAILS